MRHMNRRKRRKTRPPAEKTAADEVAFAAAAPERAVPAAEYEPPRVERLGNLRELLAKTGPVPDVPGPNPYRP